MNLHLFRLLGGHHQEDLPHQKFPHYGDLLQVETRICAQFLLIFPEAVFWYVSVKLYSTAVQTHKRELFTSLAVEANMISTLTAATSYVNTKSFC